MCFKHSQQLFVRNNLFKPQLVSGGFSLINKCMMVFLRKVEWSTVTQLAVNAVNRGHKTWFRNLHQVTGQDHPPTGHCRLIAQGHFISTNADWGREPKINRQTDSRVIYYQAMVIFLLRACPFGISPVPERLRAVVFSQWSVAKKWVCVKRCVDIFVYFLDAMLAL